MTELRIWVDRVQRVVSGVTHITTVGDLLSALSRSQLLPSPVSTSSAVGPAVAAGAVEEHWCTAGEGGVVSPASVVANVDAESVSKLSHNQPRVMRHDCLVLRRGGMEHVLSPTDRPLRLLAHSGGHLIYRPAVAIPVEGARVPLAPLRPGVTHVQLRSSAIETALKRQPASAPLIGTSERVAASTATATSCKGIQSLLPGNAAGTAAMSKVPPTAVPSQRMLENGSAQVGQLMSLAERSDVNCAVRLSDVADSKAGEAKSIKSAGKTANDCQSMSLAERRSPLSAVHRSNERRAEQQQMKQQPTHCVQSQVYGRSQRSYQVQHEHLQQQQPTHYNALQTHSQLQYQDNHDQLHQLHVHQRHELLRVRQQPSNGETYHQQQQCDLLQTSVHAARQGVHHQQHQPLQQLNTMDSQSNMSHQNFCHQQQEQQYKLRQHQMPFVKQDAQKLQHQQVQQGCSLTMEYQRQAIHHRQYVHQTLTQQHIKGTPSNEPDRQPAYQLNARVVHNGAAGQFHQWVRSLQQHSESSNQEPVQNKRNSSLSHRTEAHYAQPHHLRQLPIRDEPQLQSSQRLEKCHQQQLKVQGPNESTVMEAAFRGDLPASNMVCRQHFHQPRRQETPLMHRKEWSQYQGMLPAVSVPCGNSASTPPLPIARVDILNADNNDRNESSNVAIGNKGSDKDSTKNDDVCLATQPNQLSDNLYGGRLAAAVVGSHGRGTSKSNSNINKSSSSIKIANSITTDKGQLPSFSGNLAADVLCSNSHNCVSCDANTVNNKLESNNADSNNNNITVNQLIGGERAGGVDGSTKGAVGASGHSRAAASWPCESDGGVASTRDGDSPTTTGVVNGGVGGCGAVARTGFSWQTSSGLSGRVADGLIVESFEKPAGSRSSREECAPRSQLLAEQTQCARLAGAATPGSGVKLLAAHQQKHNSGRVPPPSYEQAIRSSCRRRPADLDLLIRTQQEKINMQAAKISEIDKEIAILEEKLENREREHGINYPECHDIDRRLAACEVRLGLAQKEEASLAAEIMASKAKIDRITAETKDYMTQECELVARALDIVATPRQDLPLEDKHREIVVSLQQEIEEVRRQASYLAEQLKDENLKGLSMVRPEVLAEGADGVLGAMGTGCSVGGGSNDGVACDNGGTGVSLAGALLARCHIGSSSTRRRVPPRGPRQLGQEMASPTQTHPIGVWV